MKKQYTNPMMTVIEIDAKIDTIDVSNGDGIIVDMGAL